MPYLYKEADNLNLLFIHIPKTGGTSFENYMSEKYNIPLNYKSLYKFKKGEPSTYQHFPIRDLWKRKDEFGIQEKDLRIIAFVRDPYDRTISDLFYWNIINKDMSSEEVASLLKKYLNTKNTFDNHKIPQRDFIVNDQDELWPNIEIVKTENLKHGLIGLGFDDFDHEDYVNKAKLDGSKIDYSDYLNDESIRLIERFYAKDFEAFDYSKRSESNNDLNESTSKSKEKVSNNESLNNDSKSNEGFTTYNNSSNLVRNTLQGNYVCIFIGVILLACLGYQLFVTKKRRFKTMF